VVRRPTTWLVLVLAVALGAVLLWPDGWAVNRLVVHVYVFFLDRGMPQAVRPEHYAAVLNVLAFVPFGWLGVVWWRRPPWAVVGVLGALSVLVETAQLWPALHRDASPVDVVLNVAGAVAGALAGSVALRRSEERLDALEGAGGDEAVDERRHPGGDGAG
jgi:glycopeptide antibiotics resistance protein